MHYFCTRIKALAYGVMVAHQILVLSVKVRVPVRQQPSDFSEGFFIFAHYEMFWQDIDSLFVRIGDRLHENARQHCAI